MEDRLKALEKYDEYYQVVHEIDHISDLHLDGSFYRQSMKIDNYFKIKEWHDSSIGQSMVIQQLDEKRPKLSNLNQTQNRRRYVNFENGSHFICSFNLNNPESTVCIAFRINGIASGNYLLLNGIIGNSNDTNYSKHILFYKTNSGLGLAISTAYNGSYVTVAIACEQASLNALTRVDISGLTVRCRLSGVGCLINGPRDETRKREACMGTIQLSVFPIRR